MSAVVHPCDFSPFQLPRFVRGISFNNRAGENVSFNHNGEVIDGFHIINWVTFPNQSLLRVKVGMIDPDAPPDKLIAIYDDDIIWSSGFNQVGFILQNENKYFPSVQNEVQCSETNWEGMEQVKWYPESQDLSDTNLKDLFPTKILFSLLLVNRPAPSLCVMRTATQVIESQRWKGNHFAAMIASLVQWGKFQIRKVRG